MGGWNDPPDYRWQSPDGGSSNQPEEEARYLGLTATQFNFAFLAVVGVIIGAAVLFLFSGAIGGLFGGEDASPGTTAAERPAQDANDGGGTDDVASEGGGETVRQLLGTFDPFTLLASAGQTQPDSAPAPSEGSGGALASALLEEGDLPAGFTGFGDMSFSIPTEEGTGEMAARLFASGDIAGGEFGTMVMSAVVAGPPGSADLDDLSELQEVGEADLDEVAAALEDYGISFTDFRLLDVSGLGDGGVGIHMVMDFGSLLAGAPFPGGEEAFPDRLAWDMYMFVRGDRMLMLMVMWPADSSSGVDGRALAETMDARAG